MKAVKFNKKTNDTIPSDLVPKNAIIGVQENKNKGFLTRSQYAGGKYMLLSKLKIQMGNCWSRNHFSTFEEVMGYVGNCGFLEMFVFETEEELFEWLAK